MKEFFRQTRFRDESRERITFCNQIIDEYQQQDLRLTLRQLYYQLVSRNVIPNSERSYKNLGGLVSDARLGGLMDWDAIEDRVRRPRKASEFDDLNELVETAFHSYRLPRWRGQDNYVELWVEKDALAGVLWPLAHEYHVTLMVNRGYSSQSAMYESSRRFIDASEAGMDLVMLYLGDHDPSGEDMVRDVADRLRMFGATIDVRKLALTMTQVKTYNPPPNPAKMTDSRAAAYVEKFGTSSWEVDALPPDRLTRIIRSELDSLVDMDIMEVIKAQEKKDKQELRAAVGKILKKGKGQRS